MNITPWSQSLEGGTVRRLGPFILRALPANHGAHWSVTLFGNLFATGFKLAASTDHAEGLAQLAAENAIRRCADELIDALDHTATAAIERHMKEPDMSETQSENTQSERDNRPHVHVAILEIGAQPDPAIHKSDEPAADEPAADKTPDPNEPAYLQYTLEDGRVVSINNIHFTQVASGKFPTVAGDLTINIWRCACPMTVILVQPSDNSKVPIRGCARIPDATREQVTEQLTKLLEATPLAEGTTLDAVMNDLWAQNETHGAVTGLSGLLKMIGAVLSRKEREPKLEREPAYFTTSPLLETPVDGILGVQLSSGPIRIQINDWPLLAEGFYGITIAYAIHIRVRRHADHRTLVYGTLKSFDDSQIEISRGRLIAADLGLDDHVAIVTEVNKLVELMPPGMQRAALATRIVAQLPPFQA